MGKLEEDRNSTIRGYFVDLQNIRARYLPTGLFRVKDFIRRKLSSKMMIEDEKLTERSSSSRKCRKSPSKKSKSTKTNSLFTDQSKNDVETIGEPVCRSWYAEFLSKYFHDGVCICEKRNSSMQRKLLRYSVAEEPKIYSIGLNRRCAKPADDFSNTDRSVENLKNCLAVVPKDNPASKCDAFQRKLLKRTFYQESHELSKTRHDENSSQVVGSFNERRKIRGRAESSNFKGERNCRTGVRVKIAKGIVISGQSKGSQTCICTHRHRRRRKQDKIQNTERKDSEITDKSDKCIERHKKDTEIKQSRRRKTSLQNADMAKESISTSNREITKPDSANEIFCDRSKIIDSSAIKKSAEVERVANNHASTSIRSEENLSKSSRDSKRCNSSDDSDDVWYEAMIYSRHSTDSQNGANILDDDTEEEKQFKDVGKKWHDSLELIREPEFLSDTTLDLSTGSFLDSLKNESSRTSIASGIFKSREQIVKEKIVETEILGNIKRRIDKDIDHSLDTDEEDIVDFSMQLPGSNYFTRNLPRESFRRRYEIGLDKHYSSNESLSSTSPFANNQPNSTFINGHYLPLKELDSMDFSIEANEISKTLEDDFTQKPEVRNTDFPFISINSFNEPEDKYSRILNAGILSSSSYMTEGLSETTLTEKQSARLNQSGIDSFSLPLITSHEKTRKKNGERDVYGHDLNFADFTTSSLAAGDQKRSKIINPRFNYPSQLATDHEKLQSFSGYPSMQDFNIEGYSPSPASNHRKNHLVFEDSIEHSRGIKGKDTSTLFYSTTCLENLKKSKHRSSLVEKRPSRDSREAKTFLFRRFLSMNVLSVPVHRDFDGNRKVERTVVGGNRSVEEFDEFTGQVSAPLAIHRNEVFLRESANNLSKYYDEAKENVDDNGGQIENANSCRSRVSTNNASSVESLTRQKDNQSIKFGALRKNSLKDFHSCENFVETVRIQEENPKEVALCPARINQCSLPVCDFNIENACSADSMDRLVNVAVSKFTEKLILFERKIKDRLKKIREKKKSLRFTETWTYLQQTKRSTSWSFHASPFSFDMPRISPYTSDEETFIGNKRSPSLSSISDTEVEIPRECAETLD